SHGGQIAVDDAPGGGARFVVSLPLGDNESDTANEAPQPAPASRRRMLVVDDEPEIVASISEILAADGHYVDTAASGVAALDRVAEAEYDIIISDLRMPDLDGPNLYERLARDYPPLAKRMIVVTGDTLSADARQFCERTKLICLEKPFTLGDVRRV